MPNIFLSGAAEFEVTGEEGLIDNIVADGGCDRMTIVYGEGRLRPEFDFKLTEKVSGTYEITRASPTTIKVVINGVLKTSVTGKTVADIVDNSGPWNIGNVGSRNWGIMLDPAPDTTGLRMTKKAPKL